MSAEGKMNPEVKALWLKALRSGEYAQSTGALCNLKNVGTESRDEYAVKGYCCLGVLTDLAVKAGVVEWERERSGDGLPVQGVREINTVVTALTPQKVVDWAGLEWANPMVRGQSLASMNDQGKRFEEIADVIEEAL
jgi:hypothetical protein